MYYPAPKQEYKVMVSCNTFNQSKYIEEALNGFVIQQTNFPFVCIVMDDASTDDEQEVIKAWMKRECDMSNAEIIDIPTSLVIIVPHKTNLSCTFAFYLLKQNLYGTGKKIYYLTPWREKCTYEAICEGDDYWIDCLKLQKQVDVLDSNPNLSSCWTGYISKQKGLPDKDMTIYIPNDGKMVSIYTLKDWQACWFTKTLTSLIRLKAYEEYREKFKHFSYARDIHLFYYLLKWGSAAYIHYPSAVYNIHEGGICSMVSKSANAVHSYNCYKELYLLERNEVLRSKYLSAINSRLKYRTDNQNSFSLLKEGLMLSKTLLEKMRVLCKFFL